MRLLIRILPLLVLLAGCASGPLSTFKSADDEALAHEAFERGEYSNAAMRFSQLAAAATSEAERQHYQLLAARALYKGGFPLQASDLLDSMPAQLTPTLALRRQLLQAEIALRQEPERALALLSQPAATVQESALIAEFHHLRACAHARLGNQLKIAQEMIERERYLTDPETVAANQTAIWQALSTFSSEALRQFKVTPQHNVLRGWMELVLIAREHSHQSGELAAALQRWKRQYFSHPVQSAFLDDLLRSRELMARPRNIALLLPLSGRFAHAGEALRDGVLAAYYSDPDHAGVTLKVYDIGSDPTVVQQAYHRAMADGAEYVIGPLDKEAVRILARIEELAVPVLALNYAEAPGNELIYQFTLSPEDEAAQVAERAWLEGHSRAAAVVPHGSFGDRLLAAFRERWQQLGGSIVAECRYPQQDNDFGPTLKQLLNIDQSEARRRNISALVGKRLEFTPRRRQDIDFVFLGAFPRQARLIRPQLKFHHAADLPIYATSHVFSGTADRNQDRDMDDITFGDMPWTLGANSPGARTRAKAKPLLRRYQGELQRLIAMGMDAYNIIPSLMLLDQFPYERYPGETGSLRVDAENRIRRYMLWAQFKGGIPRPLEDISLEQASAP